MPSKNSHGATILYLHGNAGNVSANADQVRRLAGTGLNIFIFDYRGYGEHGWSAARAARLRGRGAGLDLPGSRAPHPAVRRGHLRPLNGWCRRNRSGEPASRCRRADHGKHVSLDSRCCGPHRFRLAAAAADRHGAIRPPRHASGPSASPRCRRAAAATKLPGGRARRLYDAAADPKQLAVSVGGGQETRKTTPRHILRRGGGAPPPPTPGAAQQRSPLVKGPSEPPAGRTSPQHASDHAVRAPWLDNHIQVIY